MAEFTDFEEEQIILLALDNPDFFYRIARFIKPEYFDSDVHQYVIDKYIDFYEQFDNIPSREVLSDIVFKELKADEELAEPVIEIINKEIDPSNAPYIKDIIIKWARKKQLGMLYDEETMEAAQNGDYEAVEAVVEAAASITDVIIKPLRFFNDLDLLFEEDEHDHVTTGFSRLDANFHDGRGPAKREVYTWVAPTGVGKSIMLVNTSVANIIGGKDVLHVSLENSEKVTGHRYLGAFTDMAIAQRDKKEDEFRTKVKQIETSTEGNLYVLYFPTDTITTREIELAMKDLQRQHGFTPDVLVVDYLECLLSKNTYKNRDEYTRQKAVSNELRALAAVKEVSLFTASQTNRSGSGAADNDQNINLDKMAESYGKAMPMDYVVSINQSQSDYKDGGNEASHIGNVRFFIAKNRNGPKYKTINARINYATMKAMQENPGDDSD